MLLPQTSHLLPPITSASASELVSNLGDVNVEPEDIFRDDVNIASRLEALAEPGGICISCAVRDRIGGRLPYSFEDIGERRVKSIAHPVHAYRIRLEGEAKARPTRTLDAVAHPSLCLPYKASIAVLPFQNMSGAPEEPYPMVQYFGAIMTVSESAAEVCEYRKDSRFLSH
jgi:hypothetical protein